MKCDCDQSVGFTCLECNIDMLLNREKSLNEENKKLKEQLGKAVEVIEFYSDRNNYPINEVKQTTGKKARDFLKTLEEK